MSGSYLHTGGSYLPPGIYTGVRIVDITSTRLYETDQGQTNKDEGVGWPRRLYSGLHEKKEYRRLLNSYVANTVRFANRDSLGMAPPLACRALTMVKFPTKNGDDGLHRRVQFLNARHPKNRNRLKIPHSID